LPASRDVTLVAQSEGLHPQVVKATAELPNNTIIDGEIVALDDEYH
jgi:hypothetical protein